MATTYPGVDWSGQLKTFVFFAVSYCLFFEKYVAPFRVKTRAFTIQRVVAQSFSP